MILTLGKKYKGQNIEDVPTDYLDWMLNSGQFEIKSLWWQNAIRAELDRRAGEQQGRKYTPPPPPPPVRGLTREMVESAYRTAARKWHPDRGGTKEAMQAMADLRDSLLAMSKT